MARERIPTADSVLTIHTPDGVELELPIAGPALRIAAYSLDVSLILGLLIVVGMLASVVAPAYAWVATHVSEWHKHATANDADAAIFLAPVLAALVILLYLGELLYFSAWETFARGRTPGKYLCRLRIVGSEGQPVDTLAILTRNLLRAVDILPGAYVIGLYAMVTSRRGQRLGDYAANTLVIRTDHVERPTPLNLPADLEPLALSRVQKARLGDRELSLVRSTLRRAGSVSDARRKALCTQVAEVIATRLELSRDVDRANAEGFLQRVLLTSERE